MKLIWTPLFERDFQVLPKDIRTRTEKTLSLLLENPRHPSLRAKKMQGTEDRWEASVSMSYRITYEIAGEKLILRRVGTHDILKRETRW